MNNNEESSDNSSNNLFDNLSNNLFDNLHIITKSAKNIEYISIVTFILCLVTGFLLLTFDLHMRNPKNTGIIVTCSMLKFLAMIWGYVVIVVCYNIYECNKIRNMSQSHDKTE